MRNLFACLVSLFTMLSFPGHLCAQQSAVTPAASVAAASPVPRLIKFSGTLLDRQGQPRKGPVGVTFSLYAGQSGDAPLWLETQNVELDAKGGYTVLLGADSATGLPEDLFRNGEARWLGVQPEGETELPRVLLVSVPYALKAGDAQTLGGLPPSAFAPANFSAPANAPASSSSSEVLLATASGQPEAATSTGIAAAIAGSGTTNFIPLWTNSTTLGNSILFQNTTSNVNVNGSLSLPARNAATSAAGANSQPLDLFSSTFSSSTHAPVSQHFRWQAEPVGNNTATPSAKLNLLYAAGIGSPAETGLSINNKGIITFAAGQTLPTVTGNETVSGNVSANQLQSNVSTGTAPFVVKSTTQVANLNASFLGGMPASSFATRGANSFSGFQSIAGNGLSMYIGDVACPAGSVGIQAQVFSFGCLNFAMLVDTNGNTIINRPTNGAISFRAGNGTDQMTIFSTGKVGINARPTNSRLEVDAGFGTPINGIVGVGADASSTFSGTDGVAGVGGNTSLAGNAAGSGISAFGGNATGPAIDAGTGVFADGGSADNGQAGTGVDARGGNAESGTANAGPAVAALGGDATPRGGLGGFGILATGGKNGDGTEARAGEFHGDVEITGCLSVSGVRSGVCQSDIRLKKNIQPYALVLDKLVQLQPVRYNWKVEEFPQYRFETYRVSGLIAQEVEKVFPDMVSIDQAGYKRVNYGELPYLMLEAIRELKAENDKLQEELKTREAQWEERFCEQEERAGLQEMQQQMAALEARLARVESGGGSNEVSATTREARREMTSAAE